MIAIIAVTNIGLVIPIYWVAERPCEDNACKRICQWGGVAH